MAKSDFLQKDETPEGEGIGILENLINGPVLKLINLFGSIASITGISLLFWKDQITNNILTIFVVFFTVASCFVIASIEILLLAATYTGWKTVNPLLNTTILIILTFVAFVLLFFGTVGAYSLSAFIIPELISLVPAL